MYNSLWSHGLWPTRLLHPWDFPGKNTGVGCRFLLQGIFPTQGLNPGLPHCRQTLHPLSHKGSPTVDVPLPNKNPTASQISRIRPKEWLESSHPFFASALQYMSRAMVTKICDQTWTSWPLLCVGWIVKVALTWQCCCKIFKFKSKGVHLSKNHHYYCHLSSPSHPFLHIFFALILFTIKRVKNPIMSQA